MINGSLIHEPLTMFANPWSGSNKVDHSEKGQRSLKVGNGQYICGVIVGLVELCCDDSTLCLSNYLFIHILREIWFLLAV